MRAYERAGIPEYFIFDQRVRRGQTIDEVIGYRLVEGGYMPPSPNEDGLLYSLELEVWFGLENGLPLVVDVVTGERVPTPPELEARVAALEAELRPLRGEA